MRRLSPSTFAALVAWTKEIYSRHIVILLRILPLAERRPLGRAAHGARERVDGRARVVRGQRRQDRVEALRVARGEARARAPRVPRAAGTQRRGRLEVAEPVWKSTSASGAPDNSSLSHFSAMTRPCWLRRKR